MPRKSVPKLSLYEYEDFRIYLQDYYQLMKRETPYFSFRYFSKAAGFRSPNYLKLVMDGKRNLSADAIEKFVKALKLTISEARYFRLLVLQNQASKTEERSFFTEQLFKTKAYQKAKPVSQAQYDYFARWFYIPLRELVERSDFVDDPNWIARQFTPPVSESQVRDGLETLLKLNLIEKAETGYRQTDTAITTGEGFVCDAVVKYHKDMIRMGAEALDRFKPADRDISSVTMGVSSDTKEVIKEKIKEFRKEIIALCQKDEKGVQDIVQLNFQLFPLVETLEDDKETQQ